MTAPRIGSLFTGTGALDLAVMDVYGGDVVWHSQYEPPGKNGKEDTNQYAARILARHWPETRNLGDITKVDWQAVLNEHGPIDILTGGFPCQPFSSAGRRLGFQDERWLWDDVAHAIEVLQPGLVVLENVPGLLSAPGRQPDCVCGWNLRWGRRLGHLLADVERSDEVLADDDGADGEAACIERALGDAWGATRRSSAAREGAGPRGNASLGDRGFRSGLSPASDAAVPEREAGSSEGCAGDPWPQVAGFNEWARNLLDAAGVGGVAEGEGPHTGAEPSGDGCDRRRDCPACGRSMDDAASGFVRRAVGDVLGSLSRLGFDAQWLVVRAAEVGAPHPRRRVFIAAWPAAPDPENLGHERGWGTRHGWSGPADRDLPAADAYGGGRAGHGELPDGRVGIRQRVRHDADGCHATAADAQGVGRGEGRPEPAGLVGGPDAAQRRGPALELRTGPCDLNWVEYEPAIRRWEHVLGRPVPWPTDVRGRLSPVFTEWLMGLPAGWVTDTPGLTRAAMLRALGNGVVPQQAVAALRLLQARMPPAATAEGVAA